MQLTNQHHDLVQRWGLGLLGAFFLFAQTRSKNSMRPFDSNSNSNKTETSREPDRGSHRTHTDGSRALNGRWAILAAVNHTTASRGRRSRPATYAVSTSKTASDRRILPKATGSCEALA